MLEPSQGVDPDYARGAAFLAQGNLEAALACWQQTLASSPQSAAAHNNLGALCNRLGRFEEALARFDHALHLEPQFLEALNNRGASLRSLGHLDQALACFGQALQLKPDYADAHLGRAYTLLLAGQLVEGWAELEWRCACPDFGSPSAPGPQPAWDGSALWGRTLLLRAEQGLGDTIQFIRYAPLIQQQSEPGRLIVQAPPQLLSLLRTCPGVDEVIAQGRTLPLFHVHAFLLSLPSLLGTGEESIPAKVPYLFPDPNLVAHWRGILNELPGFKIGIVWQGQTGHFMDRVRSVRLAEFAPLAELENVRLISLQVGPGMEQLTSPNGRFPVTDLGSRFDPASFADIAAVVKQLDLIVTVDTALAHLAGALGVPVWVMLSSSPDWRWLLGREDSPWYPTMRLFRQSRQGDWAGVFLRIRDALRPLVRREIPATEAAAP